MEPEGSLPCSQKPPAGTYPEPDEFSSQFPSSFSKIHPNIIIIDMMIALWGLI